MQIATPAQPPRILQVYREALKPGSEAAYHAIEKDTARISAALGCPHPYLALESLTGSKEVWWFNGYESPAEQRQVSDEYAKNTRLIAALQHNSQRKASLTLEPIEVFAKALAGPESNIFAVRPSWSFPAKEWIAANSLFWQPNNLFSM